MNCLQWVIDSRDYWGKRLCQKNALAVVQYPGGGKLPLCRKHLQEVLEIDGLELVILGVENDG